MDIQQAASTMKEYIDDIDEDAFPHPINFDSCSKGHLIWMLNGITEGYIKGEKAHRWLGYTQGVLAASGLGVVEIYQ